MTTIRKVRIILFTAIVSAILFSGVCAAGYDTSPLADSNITITKTGSPTTYNEVGQVIAYSYVVKNTTDFTIYAILVSDDLIDNISCPSDTLEHAASMTCTGSYTITAEDFNQGKVTNQASVSGSYEFNDGSCCTCGTNTYSATASDSFTVLAETPEISLDKTGSPTTFTEAGQDIHYTYTVTNTGRVSLAGPVTVSDNRVDVSCPTGALAVGATIECSATYTTTEEDVANGVVRNTATAFANGNSSNEDSFEVSFKGTPELSLQKAAQPTNHTNTGELITYNFTLTNSGNVTLSAPFNINDPLLDELRCSFPATLEIGSAFQCNGYYRIRAGDANSTVHNCASASATYQGDTITSESACADVYYEPPAPPPPLPYDPCVENPEVCYPSGW